MRAPSAFPTGSCQPTTLDELLPAIENAQRPFDDLLAQHVVHAADHLDRS